MYGQQRQQHTEHQVDRGARFHVVRADCTEFDQHEQHQHTQDIGNEHSGEHEREYTRANLQAPAECDHRRQRGRVDRGGKCDRARAWAGTAATVEDYDG